MKVSDLSEWIRLGERLLDASPEKFGELVDALEETVDAQEVIASFDWQLFSARGRPKKRYEA